MDINKTIIQVDLAGGRTMEDVLNSNAAANVYGRVDEAGRWSAVCGPKDPRRSSDLVSYDTYVDRLYCEPPGMQDLPKKERDAVWKDVTGKRKEATRKFTFSGEAGEAYASLVTEQQQRLTLQAEPLKYYTIIPSFFTLVNTLSELDWPFTLIFRTFGSDLKDVLQEWKTFVRGEHTCKPRGPFLQRLRDAGTEPLTACMYRDKDRLFLCRGPCVSAYTLKSKILDEERGASATVIQTELMKMPGAKEVTETRLRTLNDVLQDYFSACGCIGGLVDFYPAWAQVAERREGGKVYPVSRSDERFHIFFDDNIFLGEERSIVDLREAETGASITDASEEEPFCVPVNAYEAIVNDSYFIDCLAKCLALQAARV